jgi:hypothetical protein
MRVFGVLLIAAITWLTAAAGAQTNQTATVLEPEELETILLRAVTNAGRDREREALFKAKYAFVRTKITETLDAAGELKKHKERRLPHTPAKPEPHDAPPGPEDAPPPDRTKRAYERHDIKVTPDLLRRFRFTSVGREDLAGRPAWVIDFWPVSDGLPAHSLLDKCINRMAGRVWIDVADDLVARANFRLNAPVKVVGGLVGSLKRCEVAFERRRTEEGFWFTRLLAWRLEGRKLLTRQIMTHREEIAEVRPDRP